jgi:hypothetical protein
VLSGSLPFNFRNTEELPRIYAIEINPSDTAGHSNSQNHDPSAIEKIPKTIEPAA